MILHKGKNGIKKRVDSREKTSYNRSHKGGGTYVRLIQISVTSVWLLRAVEMDLPGERSEIDG